MGPADLFLKADSRGLAIVFWKYANDFMDWFSPNRLLSVQNLLKMFLFLVALDDISA
jgi:hypothetical protein